MTQAVVLAAGYSSRAKTNKLALEVAGVPIIVRTIASLQPFCSTIFVVTGHYRDEVTSMLTGMAGVRCVYNPDYPEGMFTSVKKGVAQVTEDFLLIPGDYPLLSAASVRALLENDGIIRVPTYGGKGGHPIFLSHSLKEPLMKEPPQSNLKRFRNRYDVTWVPVNDAGILTDVDTMETFDYIKQLIGSEDGFGKGETDEDS